jgi:hypothetical protein
MATPIADLRVIVMRVIRSAHPAPVSMQELYKAVQKSFELDFDDRDFVYRSDGLGQTDKVWKRNVRHAVNTAKAQFSLVNHAVGMWRLPSPNPVEEQLDSDLGWRLIQNAARKALEANTVIFSPIKRLRYQIIEVRSDEVIFRQPANLKSIELTLELCSRFIAYINLGGGCAGRGTLSNRVALESIMVELHPQLFWVDVNRVIKVVR